MKKFTVVVGSLLLILIMLTAVAFADGTETLGDPSISIASGSGIVAAGVGLQNSQPGTLNINVPAGVTIEQVLLYWSGSKTSNTLADNTIEVDGNEITGTVIGGQAFFFTAFGKEFYNTNYRADITNLGLVSVGANSLSVEGLDNKDIDGHGANFGAGIMVIFDDGSTTSDIGVKDGLDLAFALFPEPRQSTIPQTYSFAPSLSERVANLIIMTTSVDEDRPNTIVLDSDAGDIPDIEDALGSTDGDLWDTLTLPVTVPAGATEITVELVSGSSSPGLPASLNWITAGLSVPPPLGCIGDYVWHDETAPVCDGGPDNQSCQNEDPSTNGLSGVTVRLFRNTGGGTFEQVGEMQTGSQGEYLFCELPEGDYRVDVHNPDIDTYFPSGWVSTTQNDPYPVGGPYSLGPGEIHLEADFGYRALGEDEVGLGNWVWYDETAPFCDATDNQVCQNESDLTHGLPCVKVELFEEGNPNPIGRTYTDSWGYYTYSPLPTTAAPNGYSTVVDGSDPDIDNWIAHLNTGSDPTCVYEEPIIVPPTSTSGSSGSLMQPMADPTTGSTYTMQNSNIGGTYDPTLDFAFNVPTAISLATFEVTETTAVPATWVLAAAVAALLGTGAWLFRRRQAVK